MLYRKDIALGVVKHCPHVVSLSCFGHMLNNIAKDTLEEYKDTPIFRIKQLIMHLFYSGGKIGAKKSSYFGRALDDILNAFDEDIIAAESYLRSYHYKI